MVGDFVAVICTDDVMQERAIAILQNPFTTVEHLFLTIRKWIQIANSTIGTVAKNFLWQIASHL